MIAILQIQTFKFFNNLSGSLALAALVQAEN